MMPCNRLYVELIAALIFQARYVPGLCEKFCDDPGSDFSARLYIFKTLYW